MTVTAPAGQSVSTAEDIAGRWLDGFAAALENRDLAALDTLFLADGWWRDLLGLTWDLRTFHGTRVMKSIVESEQERARLGGFHLTAGKSSFVETPKDPASVQAFFDFETAVGRGRGHVRLVPTGDAGGPWKAWTLFTQLDELKGHEEACGARRPKGADHGEHKDRKNWFDRRAEQQEFIGEDPTVIIVGAGQSGLSLGARLGRLGVSTLLVERNPRVGDNWRNRYYSLALHDPVWVDHLPYLPFPANWPIFTPKDKLADWFEAYAKAMELNVWTGTTVLSCVYDEDDRAWTVRLRRSDGTERTLRPRHLVLATGMSGEPRIPQLKGMDEFKGTIVHSSAHRGGKGWAGKKAIVIGGGNSAHDVCHEFYEQGVDVTMVQRSSTYVISSEQFLTLHSGVYEEGGPDLEDADLMSASIPYALLPELHIPATTQIAENDKELLDGLRKVGFKLDFGEDGSGLFMKYLRGSFAYYIDVGASQLIADGKIKLKQGVEVERLTEDGVQFADGTFLPADVIVMATGYANMRDTARTLIGDAADKCRDAWGLDDEGELRAVWRRSGHEGFWYMAGNLQAARHYSRHLALQIKAIEEGILDRAEPAA